MSQGHHHHDHGDGSELPAALDPTVADEDLSRADVTRRSFLRNAGLLGAGAAAVSVVHGSAAQATGDHGGGQDGRSGYLWLAGDHHIHRERGRTR